MISTADFYGGAVDVDVGSLTDYFHVTGNTVRVIRAAWPSGSGHDITLMNTTRTSVGSIPMKDGAVTHYIVNDGAVSFDVKYNNILSVSTTLGTVATGKVMIVFSHVTDTSGYTPGGYYYAVIVDKAT